MRKKDKDFAAYRATIADKPDGLPNAMTALYLAADRVAERRLRALQSLTAVAIRRKLNACFPPDGGSAKGKESGAFWCYVAKNYLVAADFWASRNANLNFISDLSSVLNPAAVGENF